MKTNLFIKFSLCLLLAVSSYAQTSKTYTESFNVNKDAVISLKTNHAEITVETWNKNRVDVEAIISVETENEDLANEILDNFEFEALGNSTKVEIMARPKKRGFSHIQDIHFLSEDDVEILTEDIRGIKVPPLPPLPPVPPLPEINFEFDMDKFNEEGKTYIKKFQKEVEEIVKDSSFKKEMKAWRDKVRKEMKENGFKDSIRVIKYRLKNDMKPKLKKFKHRLHEMRPPHPVIKKTIHIKIPKDAKLDLDVKNSELKIASLSQINANLMYSGLQIDEITSESSNVTASYSSVDIAKVNGLNLNLKYSKKVKIGEVNDLILTSKTSNLIIDLINQKALIDGSFADLIIKDIDSDFKLIDINLKNSKAEVNLPDVAYNFYINSKSSDINFDSKIKYNVNETFDSKIYQNKNTQNTSKVLNIKADYSNFKLY